MRNWAVILMLLTLPAGAIPTDYMDMVLRARTAAEARARLGITGTGGTNSLTQTNISYVAITNAPWQWASANLTNWGQFTTNILSTKQTGSANLTNWGTLATNVLATLIRTNQIVATVSWVRVTNYAHTWTITEASSNFPETNWICASWVADGGMYRVDYSMLHSYPNGTFDMYDTYNDLNQRLGAYWTNDSVRLDMLIADSLTPDVSAANRNFMGFNNWLNQGHFTLSAAAGNTVTITNSSAMAGTFSAMTNFLQTLKTSIEVSRPQTIYTIQP